MNRDRIAGRWLQVVSKAKARWGRLTNDALLESAGNYDYLVGKNREKYGVAKERAARQLGEFQHRNRRWNLTND